MISFYDDRTTAIVQNALNDPNNNDFEIIDGLVWAISDDESEEDFVLESDMRIVLPNEDKNNRLIVSDVASTSSTSDDDDETDKSFLCSDPDFDFNPATGLPMIGMLDTDGNFYGTSSDEESSDDSINTINDDDFGCGISSEADTFNNSLSSLSADDDLFSSSSMEDDSFSSCGMDDDSLTSCDMDDSSITDTFGMNDCGCGTFDDF